MEIINRFDIKIIQKIENNIYFDFFIDDFQLSTLLGFNRLEDLEFSNFDLDKIVIDR